MIALAFEIGIAKPTFCALPGSAIAVLMPITRPCASTSGPPELPGLIAASVWMTSSSALPVLVPTSRCRPEMIPRVTLSPPWSASALPIATTSSPTCTSSESPSAIVGSPVRVDLDHREVAGGVAPEDRGVARRAVGEHRLDVAAHLRPRGCW